jgi:hypothetical protein
MQYPLIHQGPFSILEVLRGPTPPRKIGGTVPQPRASHGLHVSRSRSAASTNKAQAT